MKTSTTFSAAEASANPPAPSSTASELPRQKGTDPVATGSSLAEPKRAFDVFQVSNDELYFSSFFDLTPIIRAWETLDVTDNPILATLQEAVLTEYQRHPEIQGRIEDVGVFEHHQGFLEMVMCLKYPIDTIRKPDAQFAICVPMTCELVWTSPSLQDLVYVPDVHSADKAAGMNAGGMLLILHQFYGKKLDLSRLPRPRPSGFLDLMRHQPSPEDSPRYFTFGADNELYRSPGWTVFVNVVGTPPELTQDDIERILQNPFDPEHIRSVFDPSCFEFNGVGCIHLKEVTVQERISRLQTSLTGRDALASLDQLDALGASLSEMTQVPDLKVGFILMPFGQDSRRARWTPYLRSLRFALEVAPSDLPVDDAYLAALTERQVFNSIAAEPSLQAISAQGLGSLIVVPLIHEQRCIGLLEVASPHVHTFNFSVITQLVATGPVIARAMRRALAGESERLMSVIKQTCTAIHPSVEWRFQEMARDYLTRLAVDPLAQPSPVVFSGVTPFFGLSDIRGSSTERNLSIQADLKAQLGLALEVINTAQKTHPRPVFYELAFRIAQHQEAISGDLKSGDETRIYLFLKHVVESAFDELGALAPAIAKSVAAYRAAMDPTVGLLYRARKAYDESVAAINETIGAYIDRQQVAAQGMIPHYFEKVKTDGVDHTFYAGTSMLEEGDCSPLDIRNLFLWQLMTMCGVVWTMARLKPTLAVPLDTAHLILTQTTPLSISFQFEEKHFDVDGAYNARYEIIKKRLDKACILGTGERLTQPGQIAIVYTQEHEAQMYREFFTYLTHLGFLEADFIDVLLEDLQGVHGLRALRVTVPASPPEGWDPTASNSQLAT